MQHSNLDLVFERVSTHATKKAMPQKAIRLKPNVLVAMALFRLRGESGCEVTSDSVLSERKETLELSIHAPLHLETNTTPSSVACVRIWTRIRRDNRLAAPIETLWK